MKGMMLKSGLDDSKDVPIKKNNLIMTLLASLSLSIVHNNLREKCSDFLFLDGN